MEEHSVSLAFETRVDYENFVARCPYSECNQENIFNRISDLKTTRPYMSKEVQASFRH